MAESRSGGFGGGGGKGRSSGRAPRPSRPIRKSAHLQVEALEHRWLFNAAVWLPQRLDPVDGVAGYNQAATLFRPGTTSLDPYLALRSGSITFAGSFSLTDTGS